MSDRGSWWMIESTFDGTWWAGTRFGWTPDYDKAVHFCRERDAARVLESMGWNQPAIATEHAHIQSEQGEEKT